MGCFHVKDLEICSPSFSEFSRLEHMLPARGAAYPTLAQKHLNGAVGTSRVMENQI